MPLTRLDPHAALIVVDLQKGIVAQPWAEPAHEIVARCARLARAFRAHGSPVVLVNVTAMPRGRTDVGGGGSVLPPDSTELLPEIAESADDLRVSKQATGAFHRTMLDDLLRQRGVTQVFVVGIATSRGVESTARSAQDLGYDVVLVTDAMTDRNADVHGHCVTVTFPRIGETETTERVLDRLAGRP